MKKDQIISYFDGSVNILLTCVDAIQKGYTPLHLAAKYGSIEVARLLLLQDNINVDVLAKNGLTPLHVATHYGNYNVARLLLQHHASPHSAAQVLDFKVVEGHARSVCDSWLSCFVQFVDVTVREPPVL